MRARPYDVVRAQLDPSYGDYNDVVETGGGWERACDSDGDMLTSDESEHETTGKWEVQVGNYEREEQGMEQGRGEEQGGGRSRHCCIDRIHRAGRLSGKRGARPHATQRPAPTIMAPTSPVARPVLDEGT